MANLLSIAGFSGTNGSHFELQLWYDLTQSVSGNYTDITYYLKMRSKDGYSGGGATATGYINTGQVGSFNSIGVNTTIDIGSRVIREYHNSDGTKNASFIADIRTPWALGNAHTEGSFTLPKINRIAITNSFTGDDVEGNFSVNYTKYVDSYTYKLRISIPNVVELDKITYNTSGETFTLSETAMTTLLGINPNTNKPYIMGNSVDLGFAVETWDGSTRLSQGNEVIKRCYLNNAEPIFTDFDFEDVNNTTKTLTGSTQNNVINVNGYSNIQATITTSNKAEAVKGASMVKYRFSIGENNSIDITYSDEEDVSGTLNGATSGTYNLYAIDNRNNSKLVTKQAINIINYEDVKIDKQNCSFVRDNNQVGQNAILTLSGTFWNDDFGQVVNTIKSITYRFKKSDSSTWIIGTTTITPTTSNNTFTFTGMIASDNLDTTWDLDSSYNLEVIISDELSSANVEFILNSAVPTLSLDKEGVGVLCAYNSNLGGSLQVNGKVIDEDIYSTSETLTNKIWNGKPVYRKVFTGSSSDSINITDLNIDEGFIDMGHSYIYWGRYTPIQVTTTSSSNEGSYMAGVYINPNKTSLVIEVGSHIVIQNYAITLEYTKK